MNKTAIILAGGAGTRIRHLYPDLPKPMIPIAGKPFLQWQIEWLRIHGVRRVIISAGYRADAIVAHFASGPVAGVAVDVVTERSPLGTGGAVRFVVHSRPVDDRWILVCNGDTLCPARLADMVESKDEHRCNAKILVARADDVADYGAIESDAHDGITAFIEKGRATGPGWVNAGIYCLRTAWVHALADTVPLSIEKDVFATMPPAELKVSRTDQPFLDIGVPERLAKAEEFLKKAISSC